LKSCSNNFVRLLIMGDVGQQLDELEAQNSASNIPALARQKKISELYNEMLASQENQANAPERYNNAYKEYYVYTEGSEAYEQRLRAIAVEKVVDLNKTILAQLNVFVAECRQAIDELQALSDYANNLQFVYMKMLMQYADQSNVERLTDDIHNTANRKTFYLNNSLTSILSWNTVFNVALVSLSLTFLLKAYQTGTLNTALPWLSAVGTLVISFLIVHVIIWLQQLSTPLSSFSEWTPSDKKSLWKGAKLSDKFT
jgi:hypothetical protein